MQEALRKLNEDVPLDRALRSVVNAGCGYMIVRTNGDAVENDLGHEAFNEKGDYVGGMSRIIQPDDEYMLVILFAPAFFGWLWGGIKAVASAAWEGIKSVASAAWEGIKAVANAVKEVVLWVWSGIKKVLQWLGLMEDGLEGEEQELPQEDQDASFANTLRTEDLYGRSIHIIYGERRTAGTSLQQSLVTNVLPSLDEAALREYRDINKREAYTLDRLLTTESDSQVRDMHNQQAHERRLKVLEDKFLMNSYLSTVKGGGVRVYNYHNFFSAAVKHLARNLPLHIDRNFNKALSIVKIVQDYLELFHTYMLADIRMAERGEDPQLQARYMALGTYSEPQIDSNNYIVKGQGKPRLKSLSLYREEREPRPYHNSGVEFTIKPTPDYRNVMPKVKCRMPSVIKPWRADKTPHKWDSGSWYLTPEETEVWERFKELESNFSIYGEGGADYCGDYRTSLGGDQLTERYSISWVRKEVTGEQ